MTHETPLYLSVADRIRSLIDDGTLRVGERLPSVRHLHDQWSVSVTTVLEAYRLLEDRGQVEARPRSGYYVRPNLRAMVGEPQMTDPPKRPRRVRTDLVMRLHAEMNEPGVVRFGAAVPDVDLLPHRVLARKVTEVIKRHPQSCQAYMTGAGHEPLRREIARRMVDAGCTVAPGDIVITAGAQEALLLTLRAITEPGDTVAVESPCYFGLLEILETLRLQALELRTHPRDGIDLDALEDALRTKTVKACALVTSFSNPLGSCMDDGKKRALAALAQHYKVPFIEDDIYGELSFDGPRPRALKAFDRDGWVVYVNSFSKTISPGFRIGWMVPGRYHQGAMWLKNMMSIAAPSIPQLAIASYLHEGGYDRHLRGLRHVYRHNFERAIAAIARYFPEGTRATHPRGGQLLWVEMPRGISSVRLYERVAQQRISVAPGSLFSVSGRYEHCLRLNLALRFDERVDAAFETLGRAAEAQRGE